MRKRKDGLWTTEVAIPPRLRAAYAGKARKSLYARTQKELREKTAVFEKELRSGIRRTSDDSFGAWVDRWEASQPAGRESRTRLKKTWLSRFCGLFGQPVRELRVMDLQAVLDSLAFRNPSTGSPASRDTLIHVRGAVTEVFRLAVINQALDFDPCAYLEVPESSPPVRRDRLQSWIEPLIRSTPHMMRTPAMLGLYAGLRRGEVMALTWEDIDLEAGKLAVSKAAASSSGAVTVKGPKTAAGARVIFIPRILREHLRQDSSTGLVAPGPDGRIMTPGVWAGAWKSYMHALNEAAAGSAAQAVLFTFHQLRHTYASKVYEAGLDPLVEAAQLGHSTPRISLDRYTHINEGYQLERSREKLESME